MSNSAEETSGGVTVDLSELKNFSFHADFHGASFHGASRSRQFSGGERTGRRDRRFEEPRSNAARGGFSRNFDGRGGTKGANVNRIGERGRQNFDDRSAKRDGSDFRGRRDFRGQAANFQRFEPMVDVEFYPNDEVFGAVISALKAKCNTYELFATARLFLEKPERFAVVVKKNGTPADRNLYLVNDDGFVFETENEAIAHVLEQHIEKYFTVEEREMTPPTGSFTCLCKCGLTGKILCPPNYHRYQEILANHHEKFLPNVPLRKFMDGVEKTTDPQEIENWRIASAKMRVFTPKEQSDSGKAVELKSESEVRRFFCENLKERAITPYNSVRISGATFSKMPRNLLSKSIFVSIEREKTFPLKFSNNLRGRLRRAGFTIYKIGGKSGISYISAIRRKFRNVGDVFADGVQRIISCIDANRKISIASLRLQCLPRDGSAAGKIGAVEGATPSAEVPVESSGTAQESGAESAEAQEFLKNLLWLIREGYVAEFEDGTLLATEIMQTRRNAEGDVNCADGSPTQVRVGPL
ncbi:MAG: hypothetical protein LBI61_03700 [Puniceicoccales bacterium]|jgi:hypothetical protein|nr:hypothetical protein [Puniceicoccales bacterium]